MLNSVCYFSCFLLFRELFKLIKMPTNRDGKNVSAIKKHKIVIVKSETKANFSEMSDHKGATVHSQMVQLHLSLN